jgi:hypothetical protein
VELQELADDLKLIVTLEVEDVREVLGKIREKMVMRYEVRYEEFKSENLTMLNSGKIAQEQEAI